MPQQHADDRNPGIALDRYGPRSRAKSIISRQAPKRATSQTNLWLRRCRDLNMTDFTLFGDDKTLVADRLASARTWRPLPRWGTPLPRPTLKTTCCLGRLSCAPTARGFTAVKRVPEVRNLLRFEMGRKAWHEKFPLN